MNAKPDLTLNYLETRNAAARVAECAGLAARSHADSEAIARRIRTLLQDAGVGRRDGMSRAEMAGRLGYAPVTLRNMLNPADCVRTKPARLQALETQVRAELLKLGIMVPAELPGELPAEAGVVAEPGKTLETRRNASTGPLRAIAAAGHNRAAAGHNRAEPPKGKSREQIRSTAIRNVCDLETAAAQNSGCSVEFPVGREFEVAPSFLESIRRGHKRRPGDFHGGAVLTVGCGR